MLENNWSAVAWAGKKQLYYFSLVIGGLDGSLYGCKWHRQPGIPLHGPAWLFHQGMACGGYNWKINSTF